MNGIVENHSAATAANYLGFRGQIASSLTPNPCLRRAASWPGAGGDGIVKHIVARSNAVQTLASPTNHTNDANRS